MLPFENIRRAPVNRSDQVLTRAMHQFMRAIYGQTIKTTNNDHRQRKRQINAHVFSQVLSDDIEMIISLRNQGRDVHYHFEYDASLDGLSHVELILPIEQLSNTSSKVILIFSTFNLTFEQPLLNDRHGLKINLTQYVNMFPQRFTVQLEHTSLVSFGFLTLYFQRLSRARRYLQESSIIDSNPQSFDCQVRPFRMNFADLNWTSWIVEPSSFDMNMCSGTCSTASHHHPYLTMQMFLNRVIPRAMPAACCRPARFSSTILLYYDGPNLVLKRFENMRVVQCTCS
jgi:hypothetical protein